MSCKIGDPANQGRLCIGRDVALCGLFVHSERGLRMINANDEELTRDAVAVMGRTRDPRMREIMVSLVRHLHGFVRDVRLTEAEFREATGILNEIGKLTSDTHNEAVLMAGSLGVSALVCLLNNGDNG